MAQGVGDLDWWCILLILKMIVVLCVTKLK